MEISLSKGNEQDLVAVIALVKELAKFENAGDEVEIGLEDYITGFRNGDFETILATFNKEIVGMALYYLTWSTWRGRMLYLEDLVVKEDYRRKGIGGRLLEAFIDQAHKLECNMVKWQVLDWNNQAIEMYEKFGGTIERDWWNVKIIF